MSEGEWDMRWMLSKGDGPTSSKTASTSRVTAAFVALFLSSEISGTAVVTATAARMRWYSVQGDHFFFKFISIYLSSLFIYLFIYLFIIVY